MLNRLFPLFILISIISGCNSNDPDIRVVCLRNDIGNYIIKWETFPQIEGTLKLYVSDNPGHFSKNSPAVTTDIFEGRVTYVTNDNITRKYFCLSFNDKYEREVSSRAISMEKVQNLRDLGGYLTKEKKTTRWGKLYRSGEPTLLSEWDTLRLNNLGIKTIIDLRTKHEIEISPIKYNKATVLNYPINTAGMDTILTKIKEGKLRKGDGIIFMQDLYIQFVEKNSEEFSKALKALSNEENYPVLFNCTLGKDRSGFLAAILLLTLDVPETTVMQDYMETKNYLDLSRFEDSVKDLEVDAQETIALLLTANETYLDVGLSKIRKDYGSIQKYLSEGLKITDKDRAKLKEILLY
ncbi:tyrosine-protein phosphatase [Massilibacteroides sp.]|uniref:tyrosine-protein phosphatase n=1 Tax=Massilibacteroides sp. TaxID=2034766 RepID=UPI002627E355|nr:tyrosine-protein phosphatase [Massilibacteroides sp.]MDD4516257.1 tyrosine-protein phosphatase [Massilibacteroides sp.]